MAVHRLRARMGSVGGREVTYKHQWLYEDAERPEGCCCDCGMKYSEFPDMVIPDELWERINPTRHKGAGLLCPTCISKRLDHLGLWYGLVITRRLLPEAPEDDGDV
jgi:hypothetical protein